MNLMEEVKRLHIAWGLYNDGDDNQVYTLDRKVVREEDQKEGGSSK